MTVATTTSRWEYDGDGASTSYPYDNRIFAASDMTVYVNGAQVTTGYSVSGVDSPAGGNVTFAAAPAAGARVVLVRRVPATQTTAYPPNDRFPSAAHERALDKLTVLVQQLGAELAGSIRLPEDEAGGVSAILPPAAIRAGRLVGFDAAGKLQLTTTELALDAILDAIEEAAASAASSAGAASVDRVASEAAAAAAVPAAEQAVVAARSARLDAATAANAASGISEFLKGPATTTAAAYGLPGKNLGDLDEAAPFWAERLPSVRIDLARGTGTTIDLGSVT